MSAELIIGKTYLFAQLSTSAVTIEEGAKQSITFHEKNIVWTSKYNAVHLKEEDEATGVKRDAPRVHEWRTAMPKDNIVYPEWYLWETEGLWVMKMYVKYGADTILTFSSESQAVRMYELVAQYIGLEKY